MIPFPNYLTHLHMFGADGSFSFRLQNGERGEYRIYDLDAGERYGEAARDKIGTCEIRQYIRLASGWVSVSPDMARFGRETTA